MPAGMSREFHVRTHPSRVEHWRYLIEIVALIIAALWGFYVFVYQERIKPANELPRTEPEVSLHREMLSPNREFVEVQLQIRNISGASVSLAGMIINVYGRRFGDANKRRVEIPLNGVAEYSTTLGLSPPVLLYSFYDVWYPFGAPPTKRNTIRGAESFDESLAFGIKPRQYDIAKVTWVYCYTQTNHIWLVKRIQNRDGAYAFGNLDQTSPGLTCPRQRRGEFFPL